MRITAHGDEVQDPPMPRILPEYLDCVVYLYPSELDADEGSRVGGSGFWVGVPISGTDTWHLYVVTNKHIIENGNAVIRVTTHDGRKANFPTIETNWVYHPSGDDLAVYSPSPEIVDLAKFKPSFIRRNQIIDLALCSEMNIGPGDDTFVIGRFINHEGRQRNLPTVRFGCIGQMPWEAVRQENRFMQDSFLIEARSIGGYSGSPVFLYRSFFDPHHHPYFHNVTWLLGIDWGHINDWSPVCNAGGRPINPVSPRDMQVRTNTGMMAAVPAWKLIDILDGEPFKSERDTAGQKIREETTRNPPPSATQD
jgi:hypothetical protein